MILEMLVGAYGDHFNRLVIDSVTFETIGCDTVPISNASYLTLSEDGERIFAISESGNESSLNILDAHSLELLHSTHNISPDPCHIIVHDGHILTADYSGGSVSLFDTDGRLLQKAEYQGHGPVSRRQGSSHCHQLSSFGKFIFACDLGSDAVHLLRHEASKLTKEGEIHLPAGSGPRHSVVNHNGSRLYVLSELSNDIFVIDISNLAQIQLIQTIHAGDEHQSTQAGGDIHILEDHLFASLRNGDDKIAIFSINTEDGTLSRTGSCPTSLHPRNFSIVYDGAEKPLFIVPCKNSGCIDYLRWSPETKMLQPAGRSTNLVSPVLSVVQSIR